MHQARAHFEAAAVAAARPRLQVLTHGMQSTLNALANTELAEACANAQVSAPVTEETHQGARPRAIANTLPLSSVQMKAHP